MTVHYPSNASKQEKRHTFRE